MLKLNLPIQLYQCTPKVDLFTNDPPVTMTSVLLESCLTQPKVPPAGPVSKAGMGDAVDCARCFTVQGRLMARAMCEGKRRIEFRPKACFQAGWYFLHRGEKTGFDETFAQHLRNRFPDEAAEVASEGAIVGMVYIGKELNFEDVPASSWFQESKRSVYKLKQSIQFIA